MSKIRLDHTTAWALTGLLAVSVLLGACSAPAAEETVPAVEMAVSVTDTPGQAPPADPTSTAISQPQPTSSEEDRPTAAPTQTSQATAIESGDGNTPPAFPDPSGFTWNLIVDGLDNPVDLGNPGDGTGRMFLLGRKGVIWILQNGSLLPDPFLEITDRVRIGGGETGLLGIAFHPDFAENGYFYVNYTAVVTGLESRISRFQVSPSNPNRADPGSEKILLTVAQPYRNHNGGGLAFGPDGYLYIALGDGGSANDPAGNGQSLNTLLGKLLRIDVDGGDPYAIPADNPFASGGGLPEIWAYGLRNPWRFSFDRLTGDLFIADVGQDIWEEVNFSVAGSPGGVNYGWDFREASQPFEGEPPPGLQLTDPIFEYRHGPECSVTGGYTYRGKALPEFGGIYIVGDFCSGRIWGLLKDASGTWQSQELFRTGLNISSFAQDEDGELYLLNLGNDANGAVYRLDRK